MLSKKKSMLFLLLLTSCKSSTSQVRDQGQNAIEVEIDPELLVFLKSQDIPEDDLRGIIAQEASNPNPNKGLWILGPKPILEISRVSLEEIDAVIDSMRDDQKRIAAAVAVGALGAATLFFVPGGQGLGLFILKAGIVIGAGTIVTKSSESGVKSFSALRLQKKDITSFKKLINEGLNMMLGTDTAGFLVGRVKDVNLDSRDGISDFSTENDYYFQVRHHKYAGTYFETYRPLLSNPFTKGISHPTKSGHVLSMITGTLTESETYLRRFKSLELASEGQVPKTKILANTISDTLIDTGSLLTDLKIIIGRNFRDAKPDQFGKFTSLADEIEAKKSELWVENQNSTEPKRAVLYYGALKVLNEAGVLRRQAMNP